MKHPRAHTIQTGVEAGRTQGPKSVIVTSVETPDPLTDGADVIRPMPRRKFFDVFDGANVVLPRARRVFFKASIIRTISRLFIWLWSAIRFLYGTSVDVVLRRDSDQRRAVRLRTVFEGIGPSFAKLGQQMSIRADLLPYAYCAELGKMLDRAPPMPTPEAIAIIERNLGRPLAEIFDVFDPDPIGSASLACVYQAQLRTGERVAVKVRRPGIGPLLAADLRAFDWLLSAAEATTLIRPGLTREFRENLRIMLLREL